MAFADWMWGWYNVSLLLPPPNQTLRFSQGVFAKPLILRNAAKVTGDHGSEQWPSELFKHGDVFRNIQDEASSHHYEPDSPPSKETKPCSYLSKLAILRNWPRHKANSIQFNLILNCAEAGHTINISELSF